MEIIRMLSRLTEIQRKTDDYIMAKQGLRKPKQEYIKDVILSFSVEMAECANEWQGFKFWKVKNNPKTNRICKKCEGAGMDVDGDCFECHGNGFIKDPVLEELVDALHFLLSLIHRKECNFEDMELFFTHSDPDLIFRNQATSDCFSYLMAEIYYTYSLDDNITLYGCINLFFHLGRRLGYGFKEIEEAYLKKNKINMLRQENNY